MAAVVVNSVAMSADGSSTLAGISYTTLVSGAGAGVFFTYDTTKFILLKNDSGGAAVFTVLLKDYEDLDDIGATPDDMTIAVADGSTHMLPMSAPFRNSSGQVTIECDVAGEVAVIALS